MKSSFLFLFFFCSCLCIAQKVKCESVQNEELNRFAGSIFSYKEHRLKNNSVSTFVVSSQFNPHQFELDSATQDLYISNCQDGETIDCKLYIVKNLASIEVEEVTEDDTTISIKFSYGNAKERVTEKVVIKLFDRN
ncbi:MULTISPECIES: hypothetical protein [Flavobacterium]|uniref:Uncharacterized protein n=1 Tax=Flavobacterium sedimenticola TaxID=3043286 RepID=A0ABT6XPT9_9FLAO|nr:hypothetical protein [Flavobacterium sedimenticola]MDI9257109.1 hypothetical protein [Flavobacterium sedimenticola]